MGLSPVEPQRSRCGSRGNGLGLQNILYPRPPFFAGASYYPLMKSKALWSSKIVSHCRWCYPFEQLPYSESSTDYTIGLTMIQQSS